MVRSMSTVVRAGGVAAAVVALAATGGAAVSAPGAVAPAGYEFVMRLEFGTPGAAGSRACTGVLIGPRAVLTAQNCAVTVAQPDPLDPAAARVTARLRSATAPVRVVDVRPDVAPGLALAVLDRPVRVTPASRAATAAAVDEALDAVGFGRTADTWIPDQPHLASFVVRQATGTQVDLAPGATGTGLCPGDAGAPLLRGLPSGGAELVALATAAGQNGCLGSAEQSGDVLARPVAALPSLPAATADPFDQLTLGPPDSGVPPVPAAEFGAAVATADFNKDGWPDIAVGAPGDRTGANRDVASGTVTVFAGGANGPGVGRRLLQTAFNAADEAGDRFGATLATGDFNKDGYADLAVGAPGEVVGTIKAGSIAVFNGSAAGLSAARGIDQNDLGRTDGAGDEFGRSLAAGDFNGDGATDLAVGSPGKLIGGLRSGQVTVLKGGTAGLAFGWIVDQKGAGGANEAGDLFGAALAAGNVLGAKTGTVYADLVVGAPGEAPASDPQAGGVYLFPGAAAGPVTNGVAVNQNGNGGVNEAGDRFGAALATGDFNKDGWADIAVGIPGESPRTDPQSGTATVVPGGNTTVGKGYPLEARDVTGGANLGGDGFGSAFAAGDVTGDGYADLLIGSPGRAAGAGLLYLFTGGAVSTARPDSVTPAKLIRQADVYGTDEDGDRFGAALAAADLNRDGKADAVAGSPGEGAPGEPDAGMAISLSAGF